MKILAIDTATDNLSVGISEDSKVLVQSRSTRKREHGSLLVPTIEKLLKKAKLTLNDIEAVAADIGPGSFTGLRIGLTVAKTLSYTLKIPLVGISSLDLAAMTFKGDRPLVVPVINAGRGNVYASSYRMVDGYPERESEYVLLEKSLLMENFNNPSVFIEGPFQLKIDNLCALAIRSLQNDLGDDPMKLNPLYIYPADCQVNLKSQND